MAISNSIRPVAFGLGAGLLTLASIAQQTPVSISITSAAAVSATIPPAPPQFAILATPKAPIVTCNGNLLTIMADNSTLGAVLAAVRSCVGVKVEVPAGAEGRRVFAVFCVLCVFVFRFRSFRK